MRSHIVPVHLSASGGLNQIEIYFSIVQRKVLTPNDFLSLDEVEFRLLQFQERYEQIARPFEWKFTRKDLSSPSFLLAIHEGLDLSNLLTKIPLESETLPLSA